MNKSIYIKKFLVFIDDADSNNYICLIISGERKFLNWSIYVLYLSCLLAINTIPILFKKYLTPNIYFLIRYILISLNHIKILKISNKKIEEFNIKALTFYESINFLSRRNN